MLTEEYRTFSTLDKSVKQDVIIIYKLRILFYVPISVDLKRVMCNLGENLADDTVREMISRVDTDGDGKVSFEGNSLASWKHFEIMSRIQIDSVCRRY